MATKQATKRLQKELLAITSSPPPFILARPLESNILEWHFIIRGPPDTVYHGGEYHGTLLFPPTYPFAPPSIKFHTPSGRFAPDRKICMSMSDFHPGSWNPAWSVATITTGVLSFMLSEELTTGGVRASPDERRRLAAASHEFNLRTPTFTTLFPELALPSLVDLPNMGDSPASSSSRTTTTSTTAAAAAAAAAAAVNPPAVAGVGVGVGAGAGGAAEGAIAQAQSAVSRLFFWSAALVAVLSGLLVLGAVVA